MSAPRPTLSPASEVLRAPAGDALAIVGRRPRLLAPELLAALPAGLAGSWEGIVRALEPGDAGAWTTTWLPGDPATRVAIGLVPEAASRHNSPARPDAITRLIRQMVGRERSLRLLVVLDHVDHAWPAVVALTRAFPRYREQTTPRLPEEVRVGFAPAEGDLPDLERLDTLADAVASAALWQDMPPSELHTDAFVSEARRVADEVGASCTVIRGEALEAHGLGCMWAVGRGATRPPALVVLRRAPPDPRRTVAWVGKGVVYDTGGLSLKSLAEMRGMKADMSGAAAVLGAFGAAARLGGDDDLCAVLCIAENAIGPDAIRVDDVIRSYSGRTIEVLNTDAEGRLLLADGISWAADQLKPSELVTLATLTDGQLVATGRLHGAIVSNDPELEARALASGRSSGDLVHALPYCPELLRGQFDSALADLTNTARDSGAADCSAVAQFLAEHLAGFAGSWLQVDMDAPCRDADGRGTGFGVALLLRLYGYV